MILMYKKVYFSSQYYKVVILVIKRQLLKITLTQVIIYKQFLQLTQHLDCLRQKSSLILTLNIFLN